MGWVVQAGEANAADSVKGYRQYLGVAGLYGFSVQYHVRLPWQELALAGQFPNAQVSIADDSDLWKALQTLGYNLRLVPSPGAGYHHTFVVLFDPPMPEVRGFLGRSLRTGRRASAVTV